ncbi:HlyD family secretion protein [Terricaulis sp.]|uniref:HlyD family secretion protein n=1 Tax=Terricaulis sp. TaxID=2768686 RepID=UPI002AC484DE|nr:HlyD family secretion protein [Terricaulis sp.]MDZ4690391.1 HlyD family secretion protein [Terricaulis sp.]
MPEDAGLRVEPARGPARAQAVMRRLGARGAAFLGAGALLLVITIFTINWFVSGRFHEATDNAYVRADISLISAKIEGYVQSVPAAENQSVHAGDILVQIDPTDYQARVDAARAALAQAEGSRASEQAHRALASADVQRYRPLAERGLLSPARMQQLEIQSREAGGDFTAAAAGVDAARAQLAAAELDLERTIIRAPIDGVVGDRQVQVGQLVRTGSPLMSVVPLQSVYIVANFKETQIERFHAGQPVVIRPDVAHGVRLRGVVDSIAPASGSEFSIIPTDTATGNFTKIVQRVPVRIRIEPGQEGIELLRPGLSASVTVDTRE